MKVEPFEIAIPPRVVADLRERIGRTRWPDEIEGVGWEQGSRLDCLRSLLAEWADGFDWRAQEAELNRLVISVVRKDELKLWHESYRLASPRGSAWSLSR